MPADFILVTPGIRREQDAAGDQKARDNSLSSYSKWK